MEVKLVVVNETQTGRVIPVAGAKFLIGRDEACQLRPKSSLVSRKHCAILIEEGVVAIEDFGSTNGTFVNEERVKGRRALKNNDRIRIGTLTLAIQLPVGVVAPKQPSAAGVQQTVPTVARAASTGDDIDVSGWLGDEPEPDEPSELASQSTLAIGSDTCAGKSLLDTSALPKPRQAHPEEEKKEKPKETPAKAAAKKPVKPMTDSSGEAADNALRHFFHRKKP